MSLGMTTSEAGRLVPGSETTAIREPPEVWMAHASVVGAGRFAPAEPPPTRRRTGPVRTETRTRAATAPAAKPIARGVSRLMRVSGRSPGFSRASSAARQSKS